MASGGEAGCRLVRDSGLHEELRTSSHLSEKGITDIPPGQPLRLRLLRAILDDPDRHFLRRAEQGLPLGILEGLPRTPHVFEDQTSGG